MSDIALDQVVELALKLTVVEQAKLLERVAAHLAHEVEPTKDQLVAESLAGRTYEIWSPQDEGGAVVALNQALQDYRNQKRAPDAE
ncbi:MAG: hypothetical protein ACYDBJ_12715 [Aggregatilineales bacterium]